jgi:trigger factor
MQASLETVAGLERRLNISVPADEIESEVSSRLKRLAQTVKMHGFRPGKVPLRVVQQQYGMQVRNEVLSDRLQKCFGDAVRDNNLRVAGLPRFETKSAAEGATDLEYSATFEVYPEVVLGSLSEVTIVRPDLKVGDAEVDKTVEILRKQRVTFDPVERAAQ